MNKAIFRSYDIRGVYPEDLNDETVFRLGQNFVEKTGAKHVIIGRDARLSSPDLFSSLSKGIVSRGADVYNIGQVPTEALYFSVAFYQYEGGIMITASHNPKEYNGFKMVKREEDRIEIIRGKDMAEISKLPSVEKVGEIKELNIWDDFISHVFSFVDVSKISPLRVVIDASNGMAGKALPRILERLPIETINLNFNLDGNFPSHSPNPLEEESKKEISEVIKKQKADLGFIFDGDGDRIFLLDEKGNFKRGDMTLLLLAKHFLKESPGRGIAYNAMSSRAVPDKIKEMKGNPIRTKMGFINVRKGLMEKEGIVGGETSGHYCFKKNFYCDSGLIAFLVLLQVISQSDKKASELVSESYYRLTDLNFKVKDREAVLEELKNNYSDGKQDFLDGITVEYEDWWFIARPSNTEPLLRVAIEADSENLLERKRKEIEKIIQLVK